MMSSTLCAEGKATLLENTWAFHISSDEKGHFRTPNQEQMSNVFKQVLQNFLLLTAIPGSLSDVQSC